jgi:hypothetical protein
VNSKKIKKKKMAVLKLDHDDEKREMEFEIQFQKQLSLKQIFAMLEEKKRIFLKQLIDNGHRKSSEIVKRS